MTVELLIEQHLKFLSLKGGCTCSSESTFIKMPHCWKSHVSVTYCYSSTLKMNSLCSPATIGDIGLILKVYARQIPGFSDRNTMYH